MKIERIDHLVLTVKDIAASVDFYTRVLGMREVVFGPQNRRALAFGQHKINLHEAGREFEPKADRPTAGSGDLCFVVDDLEAAARHLAACGVPVIDGPVPRTGALGAITSIYLRDPDGNLIELSQYA